MKKWMLDYKKRLLEKGLLVSEVTADAIDDSLKSVVECPQQLASPSDCGIFVCFIMRQYVHNVKVDRSMDELTLNTFRAALVKTFMNDPRRGLSAQAV
ncbi:hypothetical protein CsSME_00006968 [Camellia sinensis var. sinensis]